MKIKKYKLIILAFCCVTLSSCNVIDNNQSARIKTKINDLKISNNLRSYSECIEDGKSFDNLASNKNSEAESLYNKSAKILYDCDLLIRENSYMIDETERMKNAALSIQNYIKAGNLIQASLNFQDFQDTFDKDLVYKDGSSFVENVKTILSHNSNNSLNKFALTNNSRIVRSELKRLNYWSKN